MVRKHRFIILYADDDNDDQLLMREALVENRLPHEIRSVIDGEELMDYLHHRGAYRDPERAPQPDLILLDLNMPKKNGIEALAEIKSDKRLRRIPVVVITTSRMEEDIIRTYDLGVNSFVTKPPTFEEMSGVLQVLGSYWFNLVQLPSHIEGRDDRKSTGGPAD